MAKVQKIISMITIFSLVITSFAFLQADNTYAAKKVKKYKVTFKANKGKFTTKKYAKKKSFSKKIKKGKKLGKLPKVKRTNYTFKGWYTKKSGGKKVTAKTKIKKKTTLYARWGKKKTTPLPTVEKFQVDKKYFSLIGTKYSNNSTFATKFPNLTYSDYCLDEWEDEGVSYYYEAYYYYDDSVNWNCYYSLTRYQNFGDFHISDISTTVRDIINTNSTYDYKTFLSKLGVSSDDYAYEEYTIEGEKFSEVLFSLYGVGWNISVDPNTKMIAPSSSLLLYQLD